LRLVACSSLHSKLISKLFPTKFCSRSLSSLACIILRRVCAKLAGATPEGEAAALIAWGRQAFDLERLLCDDSDHVRILGSVSLSITVDRISVLAATSNGLLRALVSCGACELLVDVMLHTKCDISKGFADFRGCQVGRGSRCGDDRCECDYDLCNYTYHRLVRAGLVLASCTAGAYKLYRAGWNPYWVVVRYHGQDRPEDYVIDALIKKLTKRGLQSAGVPPVIQHSCALDRHPSRCDVLLALLQAHNRTTNHVRKLP
jgi:hypothetical protein